MRSANGQVVASLPKPKGNTRPGYGELEQIAWYDKNSGGRAHPVAAKQANTILVVRRAESIV